MTRWINSFVTTSLLLSHLLLGVGLLVSTPVKGATAVDYSDTDLLVRINKAISRLPEPSVYLYETTSITGAIAHTWTEMTAGILGKKELRAAYDEFYLTSVEYAGMVKLNLYRAERAVNKNNLTLANHFYENALRYERQFHLSDKAAIATYNDDIDATIEFTEGIYKGSKAAVLFGSAMVLGPSASRVVDTVFDVTDFAVQYSESGLGAATKEYVANQLTGMIFRHAKVGGKTLEDLITHRIGDILSNAELAAFIREIVSKPGFADDLVLFLEKAGGAVATKLTTIQAEKIISNILGETIDSVPALTVCGATMWQKIPLQFYELGQALDFTSGGHSFNSACDAHDSCYGDCNTLRDVCDKKFLSDMEGICRNTLYGGVCFSQANLFYGAVSKWGDKAFENVRRKCSGLSDLGQSTALVIDKSGSMGEPGSRADGTTVSSRLAVAKEALRAYINTLDDSETVSISSFSNDSATHLSMQNGRVGDVAGSLHQILQTIQPDGDTNIGAGLSEAFSQLDGSSATEKFALLLSDGENNVGDYGPVVSSYVKRGWPICTIGFGTQAGERQLKAIARQTGCSYSFANAENLVQKYQEMSSYTQNRGFVLQTSDLLPQSGKISYPFTIYAGAESVRAYSSWGGSKLRVELTDPSGRKYTDPLVGEPIRLKAGSTFQMLEIKQPESGQWTLEADWAVPPSIPEQVNITVSEKTDVFVRTHGLRPYYAIGEPVQFKVDAMEVVGSKKQPLLDADVRITVQKPGEQFVRMIQAQSSNWTMFKDIEVDVSRDVTMFDDGAHDERAAGDGIFAGRFAETDINGPFVYSVKITGQHRDGREVERSITGSFQVGSILQNPVSASEVMMYKQQVPAENETLDPFSDDADQDLLDRIKEMEGDGLDLFDK